MPGGARETKMVQATQTAVDALPYNSGTWRIAGSMGLYVRCRAKSKSYLVQRKVAGKVIHKVIGQVSLAEARRRAQKIWTALRPKPTGRITLGEAWAQYLEERPLAATTRAMYEYNLRRYLAAWRNRTLEAIGEDRAGVRSLYHALRREHGIAIASQVLRMFAAVYRYHRRVNLDLPPCPTEVVDIETSRPRDWAMSGDELRTWWAAVERLNPLKRTFWLVVLLTGARRGSVEALRWSDVDFARRTIHFSTAKAGRTYTVPACRRLLELLCAWREYCPPTEAGWVFPSPYKPETHIVATRDEKRGVASAHHLRHTYRTVLAELGATPDQARLLLGHSLSGDVSRGYITPHLVIESLRPIAEAVAARYAEVLGWECYSHVNLSGFIRK
jgi:integrase